MVIHRITVEHGGGRITGDFKRSKGIYYKASQSDNLIEKLYTNYYNKRPIILVLGGLRREPKAMNVKRVPLRGYIRNVPLNRDGDLGLEIVVDKDVSLFVHTLDIVAIKDYYLGNTVYKVRGYYEPKVEEYVDSEGKIILGVYKEFKEPFKANNSNISDIDLVTTLYTLE